MWKAQQGRNSKSFVSPEGGMARRGRSSGTTDDGCPYQGEWKHPEEGGPTGRAQKARRGAHRRPDGARTEGPTGHGQDGPTGHVQDGPTGQYDSGEKAQRGGLVGNRWGAPRRQSPEDRRVRKATRSPAARGVDGDERPRDLVDGGDHRWPLPRRHAGQEPVSWLLEPDDAGPLRHLRSVR